MSSTVHYSASVLADSPLFYWRLAEPATGAFPTKAFDASGNGNTGSYTNIGGGISFGSVAVVPSQLESEQLDASVVVLDPTTGGSGSVRIPCAQLSIGSGSTGSFSVEFWVKPKFFGTGSNHMVVAGSSSLTASYGEGYFQFTILGQGSAECGINGVDKFTATQIPSGTFKVGRSDHVVFTYDSVTQKGRLYRDGRLFAGPQTMLPPSGSWPEFIIGSPRNGSTIWNGHFDEVAVYKSVLPDGRVRAHWDAAFSTYHHQVICDAPKLYWRMDDASGSAPNIRDFSSNSRSGSIVGSPANLVFSASALTYNSSDAALSGNDPGPGGTVYCQFTGSTMEIGGAAANNRFSVEWWLKPGKVASANNTIGRGLTWFTAGGSGSNGEGFCGIGVADLLRPPQLGPGFFQFDKVGHYVFTYDGSYGRVYKNGYQVAGRTMGTPSSWGAVDPFKVAVSGAWQGTYDEVAVYGYALPSWRVLDHWQQGFNVTGSGASAPTFTTLSGTVAIVSGGDYLCVTGSNFQIGASIIVKSGTFAASGTFTRVDLTGTTTYIYFNAPTVPVTGVYDVVVLNPDSSVATGSAALTYVTGSPYESAVVGDRPVLYWRLNESSGSLSAADRSNHLNTGSILNSNPFLIYATTSLVYDRGKGDYAFAEFNPSAPVPFITITSPNLPSVPLQPAVGIGGPGAQSFSVEFWIKMRTGTPPFNPESGSTGTPRAGFNVPGFLLNVNAANGTTTAGTDSTSAITASNFIGGTNKLHYVVYTFSASDGSATGTGRLYRDGVLVTSATQNVPTAWTAFQFLGPVSGTFDEIAVYDYPLTLQQVNAHYETGFIQESQDLGYPASIEGSPFGGVYQDFSANPSLEGTPFSTTYDDFINQVHIQGQPDGYGCEDLFDWDSEAAYEGAGSLDTQKNAEFLFFPSGTINQPPGDVVPPELSNFSPAYGNPISSTTVVSFDVTDNSGMLRRAILHAAFSGISGSEVIHDGEQFNRRYYSNPSNTATEISGGFHYTVLRDGGWPAQFTLIPLVYDPSGNENA